MTEYQWRTARGQVTVTRMHGKVECITWRLGKAELQNATEVVPFPASDNISLPAEALTCLGHYWRTGQPTTRCEAPK